MSSVTLPAFAKVNLFLDVLGKRPDGYHELVTLFERIDAADTLTVERAAGSAVELESDSPEIPTDGTNLAVRAAEAFRRESGWTDGIRIRLEKRIPVGGGLGGGSSDAAAVLAALQRLSGGALPAVAWTACARELGADVAFFAADTPWGVGRARGDEIEPKSFSVKLWHLLVKPDFPIPTKAVYEGFVPADRHPDIAPLLQALAKGRGSEVRSFLYNALEPTVEKLYPEIRRVKSEIELVGLKNPMVSGSGSTVFALCDSQEQAEKAAKELRKQHPSWKVFVAETI